jgi:hypothetical protein
MITAAAATAAAVVIGWLAYSRMTSRRRVSQISGTRANVPDAQPLTDDKPLGPAPDPKLFVTYAGDMGKGKPGTGAGAHAQGVANVVNKIKGALD